MTTTVTVQRSKTGSQWRKSRCFLWMAIGFGSIAHATATTDNTRCSPQASWRRPSLVAILSDAHMGAERCSSDGQLDCQALVERAATYVKRLQPDLILWAGDLLQNPQDSRSYNTMTSILDDMSDNNNGNRPIPYHVLPGNTDVNSVPTIATLDAFRQQWNLPYYWYTVQHYQTLFVLLDSNVLRNRDNDQVDNDVVSLAWEELEWLENILQEANVDPTIAHVVVVAHHPLAVQSLNEGTTSENTPRDVRLDLARLYQSHLGLVKLVVSGHLHYAGRVQGQSPLQQYVSYPATTFILGDQPRGSPGFALLKIDGSNDLGEQFYEYNDMPMVRPESDVPGFEITSPNDQKPLVAGSPICITWISQSMTNYVRLDYSLNGGQQQSNWSLIADNVPNDGAWPWTVPRFSSSNTTPQQLVARLWIRISSVHNSSISFVSQEGPVPIVAVMTENDNGPTLSPTFLSTVSLSSHVFAVSCFALDKHQLRHLYFYH